MRSSDTVAIVGVGLIGGSIGLALRRAATTRRVIGIGRREASLAEALARGAVTETTTDLSRGVADADLIVVCTPVESIAECVLRIAHDCPRHAIITDAGSTKARLVARLRQISATGPAPNREPDCGSRQAGTVPTRADQPRASGPLFIGSHPIAGSERTGVAAARADLFDERVVVVTPTEWTGAAELSRLTGFWESLGAHVRTMTPDEHDRVLACTSHAPHVVASALAVATPRDYLPLTGGGWRDTTRVAAGDADLWRQILASNSDHVLKSLDEFAKKLAFFRQALADDDQEALRELLQSGKSRRDALGS